MLPLPNLAEAKRLTTYCSHARNTSKMWILPDGCVVSIFVQHYEWALVNRQRLQNSYGIDLNRIKADTPVRLFLLSKGAVRVNYEHRGGKLTLEASQDLWGEIQQNAFKAIVQMNAKDVDFIGLRLLNKSGRTAQEAVCNLVGLTNAEKLKRLPVFSVQTSRPPSPEPQKTKDKAAFWNSVLGTKFRDLEGQYISEVGKAWDEDWKISIITAWNPFFKKASKLQNKRKNQELKRMIKEQGWQFREINAWWPDGSDFEHSFVIQGLSHQQSRELCLQFGQGAYFYGTRGKPIRLVNVQ